MTKTETDIKLIKEEIAQWEAKTTGSPLKDHGCPLCDEYPGWECNRCPIKLVTGSAHCVGTPYEKWDDAGYDDEAALIAVYLELEFLYLLLSSHYDKLGEGK
jgi:hypothetical protein